MKILLGIFLNLNIIGYLMARVSLNEGLSNRRSVVLGLLTSASIVLIVMGVLRG
jgi:hypothetical protein